MNIIFFIGEMRGGGAEGVVATLTSQLADRGHRITLVSHLEGQAYELSSNVCLKDLRLWQYDTYVGNQINRLYKKIANRFLDYKNIRQIIKTEKPDIVITFIVDHLTQLIMLCKSRIPIICAERNALIYPHGRNNFYNKQILYRLADVVQVMSKYDKAWSRDRYKKVIPMPNPLRFSPLEKEKYTEIFKKRKNILACGRLNPQKGFDKLIASFAKIADSYPDWDIDICGEDMAHSNYSKVIVKQIEDYNLQDRVHFIGFHKDVDVVMQKHSIFCLSSQHEGFPNVLSEAMANGLACISFDIVTGPSEIIMDGVDGLIVEDQNIDDLANGLSRLIEDENLRFNLGLNAIDHISRFEKSRIVDKWENMFQSVIANYKK